MVSIISDSLTFIQGFCHACMVSTLLCIIAAEVRAIFIDTETWIKGIQIGRP